MQRSEKEVRALRDSIRLVGRLSDNLVRIGPFSVGLDGVLSWFPGLGELYSVLAGAFILVQGRRAGAPAGVLLKAATLLGLRTLASIVPIAGSAFADVFTAHKWAAAMIVEAIDRQMGWGSLGPDPGAPAAGWRQARA